MLLEPTALLNKALRPIAILDLPVVFSLKVPCPKATLYVPLVLYFKAVCPKAVLYEAVLHWRV